MDHSDAPETAHGAWLASVADALHASRALALRLEDDTALRIELDGIHGRIDEALREVVRLQRLATGR